MSPLYKAEKNCSDYGVHGIQIDRLGLTVSTQKLVLKNMHRVPRKATDSRNLASGVICAEFKILNKTIIWSFYLELKRANSIPSTVNLEGEEKTRGVTLQKNRFFFRYYLSKMDE